VILILEVVSPEPTSGGASRQTFHEEGGSIGRESGNSWVLPHAKVSGLHALITFRNDAYYIEDRSRNGVCLNSSNNRLERGRPYPLKSGDSIAIGPYEIRVSVADDQGRYADAAAGAEDVSRRPSAHARGEASDPFDSDDPFAPRPIESAGLGISAEEIPGQPLDPLELLNLVPKRAPRKARSSSDLQLGSPLDGHYRPPSVVPDPVAGPPPSAMAIPEDYDPLAPDEGPPPAPLLPPDRRPDERVEHRRDEARVEPDHAASARRLAPREDAPPPPERAAGRLGADVRGAGDLASVLAGAGLDPADLTPEMARDFGQILRVVVSGVMDVMRSRQQIKDEFRLPVTRVRSAENNPLKFSANVDDALHNLLVKRSGAYLPPVEAFEDAFADLRDHQVAMLAGMRVAFESMLAEFDPDHLQQEFDRQLNKGLVPARLRYWDLYREKRQQILKDPEGTFRQLFGEEFARAYEDQLRKLKAQDRRAAGATSRSPTDHDA
jgi:type VI secretion system FHA domain protein